MAEAYPSAHHLSERWQVLFQDAPDEFLFDFEITMHKNVSQPRRFQPNRVGMVLTKLDHSIGRRGDKAYSSRARSGSLDLAAERGLANFAHAIAKLEQTTFRRPEALLEELLRKRRG